MRIEVEVYKGPLSLEPEIQLGELFGFLREAYNGLQRVQDIFHAVGKAKGLYGCPSGNGDSTTCTFKATDKPSTASPGPQWCANIDPSSVTVFEGFDFGDCSLLKMLSEDVSRLQISLLHPICKLTKAISDDTCNFQNNSLDAKNLKLLNKSLSEIEISSIKLHKSSLQKLSSPTPESLLRDALIEANRAAAVMQASAFRYANATTGGRSTKFSVRKAQTHFIAAASEYANQIQARADALLKQLGETGRDRRELPLSTHLREAEPTDFVHLYDWMSATTPSLYPLLVFSLPQMPVTQRIKVMDRLYADHFWSKINTVYASGRGKTQMAFIKDETGNWNLKSFDNDPTELLTAYTKVAKSALEKAAQIAAGASTWNASSALPLAQKLVSFAAESEPDQTIPHSAPAGTVSLAHLRARLADKLDPGEFEAAFEEETKLLKVVNGIDPDAAKAAQADLSRHRKQVITRWESALNDHSNLVDILGSTIKKR